MSFSALIGRRVRFDSRVGMIVVAWPSRRRVKRRRPSLKKKFVDDVRFLVMEDPAVPDSLAAVGGTVPGRRGMFMAWATQSVLLEAKA